TVVVRPQGSKDETSTTFAELSRETILAAAHVAGRTESEELYLGQAVWLNYSGEPKLAAEALRKVGLRSETAIMLYFLLEEQGAIEKESKDASAKAPSTTSPISGSAVFDPKKTRGKKWDDRALAVAAAERKAQLEAAKQAGRWEIAYASEYYDFFSNGSLEDVKDLASRMDLVCEEYKRIFNFKTELGRPFTV